MQLYIHKKGKWYGFGQMCIQNSGIYALIACFFCTYIMAK